MIRYNSKNQTAPKRRDIFYEVVTPLPLPFSIKMKRVALKRHKPHKYLFPKSKIPKMNKINYGDMQPYYN
jgi:hypothetical protein